MPIQQGEVYANLPFWLKPPNAATVPTCTEYLQDIGVALQQSTRLVRLTMSNFYL
jgi:hypothetical protein